MKLYGDVPEYIGSFFSEKLFFEKELFVVTDFNSKMYGVVNREGNAVIDFKYRYIGEFVKGIVFCVRDDEKWFFIDKTGHVIIEITSICSYQSFYHTLEILKQPAGFYDGYCLVKEKIPIKNKTSGEPRPDSAIFFYFDATGKIRLTLSKDIKFAENFFEGLAAAVNSAGLLGFINQKGEWVIQPKYQFLETSSEKFSNAYVPEFKGGYAYIKSINGYIDKNGTEYFTID